MDPSPARRLVEKMIPDRDERRAFLDVVAEVVAFADKHNPQNWSVTLNRTLFRVNQGRVLLIDLRGYREAGILVDDAAAAGWRAPRQSFVKEVRPFSAVRGTTRWTLATSDLVAQREALLPLIRAGVPAAAASTTTAIWASAHDASLLDYIAEELRRPLPRPRHGAAETFTPRSPEEILARAPEFWKIAPGRDAALWPLCLDEGCIAVGWSMFGDLTGLSREAFRARASALRQVHPDISTRTQEHLWRFAHAGVGSVVVANSGTRVVKGFGRVAGPYQYLAGHDYPHRLPVEWFDVVPRSIDEPSWRMTFVRLNRERVERYLQAPPVDVVGGDDGGPPDPSDPPEEPPYTLASLAHDTMFSEGELAAWVRSIRRKGQCILAGPPGTGKTFLAERIAQHLIDDGDGEVELVQFHPSYAYEDFVQGLRPVSRDGALQYELVPGSLLRFLETARRATGTSVLVVDEINRANLSRVFGELMHAIEYRERPVPLAGGGSLTVPRNVIFLGTMNTADRSIALVDHALRRRFAWLRLTPRYDVLARWLAQRGVAAEGLVAALRRLNDAMQSPDHEVGISFFLRDDLPREIEAIWREEVVPYVEEHFFDEPRRVDPFRWEAVRAEIGWP